MSFHPNHSFQTYMVIGERIHDFHCDLTFDFYPLLIDRIKFYLLWWEVPSNMSLSKNIIRNVEKKKNLQILLILIRLHWPSSKVIGIPRFTTRQWMFNYQNVRENWMNNNYLFK